MQDFNFSLVLSLLCLLLQSFSCFLTSLYTEYWKVPSKIVLSEHWKTSLYLCSMFHFMLWLSHFLTTCKIHNVTQLRSSHCHSCISAASREGKGCFSKQVNFSKKTKDELFNFQKVLLGKKFLIQVNPFFGKAVVRFV